MPFQINIPYKVNLAGIIACAARQTRFAWQNIFDQKLVEYRVGKAGI